MSPHPAVQADFGNQRYERRDMKTAIRVLLWMSLLLITSSTHAQTESGNDDPSFTSNLGMPLSVPLNPTARFVSGGWGVDYGAGYNFTRRHAVIGEFMWNSLYASNEALQQVRAALQSSKVSGHGNLFAFTGNYRYELRGRVVLPQRKPLEAGPDGHHHDV